MGVGVGAGLLVSTGVNECQPVSTGDIQLHKIWFLIRLCEGIGRGWVGACWDHFALL